MRLDAAPTGERFTEPLETVVARRADGLTDWLAENAPQTFDEHEHLHEGTPEQAYWHYGYLAALRDIQNYIERRKADRN